MHGLGNDFVVIDSRNNSLQLDVSLVRAMADRRTGIGCDQLIVLHDSQTPTSDIFMQIYNADGVEASNCGNAARCVAAQIMNIKNTDQASIETISGVLTAQRNGKNVTMNMGQPRDQWEEIPLKKPMDTLHMNLSEGTLSDPVCVNIGNPHTIFFVQKINDVILYELGPKIETNQIFPERTNVEIVQVIKKNHLRVRVWERGVGITLACGTGACASLVAACRRGLTDRQAQIELDGGFLNVSWVDDGDVFMTGPTAISYTGSWQI